MKTLAFMSTRTTRRMLCLAIVLYAPPTTSMAQTHVRHGHGAAKLDVQFPPGVSVVEVPFRFESSKIVVDVRVNGSAPLPFVLDTGAPLAAIVKPGKLEGINVDYVGQVQVGGAGSSGGDQMARYARGVRFDVGDLMLGGAAMVVLAEDGLKHVGKPPWDGIIGGQLLASVVVEIDWGKSRLRLHDRATFKAPAGAISVPLRNSGGYIFISSNVTIDGESRPVQLVIDTGASHALSLRPDRVGLPQRRVSNTTVGRGLNGVIKGDYGRIDKLQLGGTNLVNVVTSFVGAGLTALGGDGNLGTKVLRRFKVTFDYARDRMLLEPTEAIAEPFVLTTSGVRFEPWVASDGSIAIDDVIADSPAAQAGLVAGDRIIAVNSQSVGELGVDVVRDLLRQAPGTRVKLKFRRVDSVHQVELKLDSIL